MNVPINRAAWSPASQRAGAQYDEQAEEYEGIRYPCHGCEKSFVLTAHAQQIAFEVEKKFVWWRPTLCPSCAVLLADLRIQDGQFQAQWNVSRAILRTDHAFVTAWVAVLREIARLAKHNSMQTHLERLL